MNNFVGLILIVISFLLGAVLAIKFYPTQFNVYSDITNQFDLTTMAFPNAAVRAQAADKVSALLKDIQVSAGVSPNAMKDITLFTILTGSGVNSIRDTINYKMTKMHNDANYVNIMKRFDQSTQSFGKDRNTAITILGTYFKSVKLTTNPQSMKDVDIYLALISSN